MNEEIIKKCYEKKFPSQKYNDSVIHWTFKDMMLDIVKEAKKEVFDDEGCHVEGEIAKALEEYGIKENAHDMAFFIMKRLREELNTDERTLQP